MPDFYVPDEEIDDRAALLDEIAISLVEDGIIPDDEIVLRRKRIKILTNGYFLLNKAYKRWRIAEGHFTRPPKIAALQSMSIMTFLPYCPIDPNNATTIVQAKPNELYAVAAACAILGISVNPNNIIQHDFWLRLLDMLSEARADTLEMYLVDLNNEIHKPLSYYNMQIANARDMLMINSLVNIFELLSSEV